MNSKCLLDGALVQGALITISSSLASHLNSLRISAGAVMSQVLAGAVLANDHISANAAVSEITPGIFVGQIPASKLFNLAHPERIPNEYIVVFKNVAQLALDVPKAVNESLDIAPGKLPSTKNDIEVIGLEMAERYRSKDLRRANDTATLRRVKHVYTGVFPGFSLDAISEKNVLRLAQDPRVLYVEAAVRTHLAALSESVQSTGAIICMSDPTLPVSSKNPCYGDSSIKAVPCPGSLCAPWNLDEIDGTLDGHYSYYANGAGVTIWILDTGITLDHDDFGGRAGATEIIFTDSDVSSDFTIPESIPNNSQVFPPTCCDLSYHGTAVASLAAGKIAGVAKSATIRALQAFVPDNPSTTTLIAAVDYVINHKSVGPNVINMSVEVASNDSEAPSLQTAVARAIAMGITFVTSAGNEGVSACSVYPAGFPNVVTVGSTIFDSYEISSYSNYGPCVSLFAPGNHVTIADNQTPDSSGSFTDMGACVEPTNGSVSSSAYCTASGTSFASPIVAGIAALYLQINPGATPAQVKSAILAAAKPNLLTNVKYSSPNLLADTAVAGNTTGTPTLPGRGAGPRPLAFFQAVLLLLQP